MKNTVSKIICILSTIWMVSNATDCSKTFYSDSTIRQMISNTIQRSLIEDKSNSDKILKIMSPFNNPVLVRVDYIINVKLRVINKQNSQSHLSEKCYSHHLWWTSSPVYQVIPPRELKNMQMQLPIFILVVVKSMKDFLDTHGLHEGSKMLVNGSKTFKTCSPTPTDDPEVAAFLWPFSCPPNLSLTIDMIIGEDVPCFPAKDHVNRVLSDTTKELTRYPHYIEDSSDVVKVETGFILETIEVKDKVDEIIRIGHYQAHVGILLIIMYVLILPRRFYELTRNMVNEIIYTPLAVIGSVIVMIEYMLIVPRAYNHNIPILQPFVYFIIFAAQTDNVVINLFIVFTYCPLSDEFYNNVYIVFFFILLIIVYGIYTRGREIKFVFLLYIAHFIILYFIPLFMYFLVHPVYVLATYGFFIMIVSITVIIFILFTKATDTLQSKSILHSTPSFITLALCLFVYMLGYVSTIVLFIMLIFQVTIWGPFLLPRILNVLFDMWVIAVNTFIRRVMFNALRIYTLYVDPIITSVCDSPPFEFVCFIIQDIVWYHFMIPLTMCLTIYFIYGFFWYFGFYFIDLIFYKAITDEGLLYKCLALIPTAILSLIGLFLKIYIIKPAQEKKEDNISS